MKKYLTRLEDWFLSSVAIDHVALDEITLEIMRKWRYYPTARQFQKVLAFIIYLHRKYGKHLRYTIGTERPIDKNFYEFLAWLQDEYNEGRYKLNIDWGVWFDLDEEVIPKQYHLTEKRIQEVNEYLEREKNKGRCTP